MNQFSHEEFENNGTDKQTNTIILIIIFWFQIKIIIRGGIEDYVHATLTQPLSTQPTPSMFY